MTTSSYGPSEVSFLGTGDVGPVHGPKDGFPIARYTEFVRPTLAAKEGVKRVSFSRQERRGISETCHNMGLGT